MFGTQQQQKSRLKTLDYRLRESLIRAICWRKIKHCRNSFIIECNIYNRWSLIAVWFVLCALFHQVTRNVVGIGTAKHIVEHYVWVIHCQLFKVRRATAKKKNCVKLKRLIECDSKISKKFQRLCVYVCVCVDILASEETNIFNL